MGMSISTDWTYDTAWMVHDPINGTVVVPYVGYLTAKVREGIAEALAKHYKLPPMASARLVNDARDGTLRGEAVRDFHIKQPAKPNRQNAVSFTYRGGSGFRPIRVLPEVMVD